MPTRKRLSQFNLLGYAMGDLGGCMTFALLGSFLTPYYTEVAGMSTASVAAMYLVLKIWDAVNDPLMGSWMDKVFARSENPKGKFRPWMMRATPLLAISAILMWTAPTFVGGTAKMLVAFVTYLLYEASYTMFNIPYGALLSAMSGNDQERTSLSSARGFGSMIGNLFPLLIFPYVIKMSHDHPQLGYTVGICICAAIGFLCCMLSCRWTTERFYHHEHHNPRHASNVRMSDILHVLRNNRPFVALCLQGLVYSVGQYIGSTLSIYMYRDILGDVTYMSMATIITMPLSFVFLAWAPKLTERFGMERTVRATQLISAALYCLVFSVLLFTRTAIVYMLLIGLAQSFGGVTVLMQWALVGEAIDYNEMRTGKRAEGSIYGFFNLTRRIGQAIGASAAVSLLSFIGYVPGAAAQTDAVYLGIQVLVVLVPAALMVLCWLILKAIWNITPAIRDQIAAFKETADS